MEPQLQGHWDAAYAPIADELRRQLAHKTDTGAALCIYRGERPVVDVWGGVRDAAGQPWEQDTMVLCYSTGKGVASTLLHILIDAGMAHYDDPVARHWPEFARSTPTFPTAASHARPFPCCLPS